jgi:two-component system, chemotaxis family, CheB/CheR fusion protein
LDVAVRYAHVPSRQAVISPSTLSLMYPADEFPGYSREQFIPDLLQEHETEVRHCLASEQDLRDFFDNAAVGLNWVGQDGIVMRVNQTELDLLGYTRHEYVGHHIAEFHADADVIDDFLHRLSIGQTVRDCSAQMRCKDGSIKHVLINSNVLWEDGKFVHSRCFTRDITEQKRAEEARALLAAIVEASDDAIVSKTLDGVIRSWNAGAERLFGHTAAEAIGQSIDLIIPPELRDEERAILSRLRRGERIEHFETIRISKHARRIDISLTISPVRDSAGRIVGASKVARDITERKRAEDALRQLAAELSEADRRKNEFLAMLAHELRNPLAPIRNALQIVQLSADNGEAVRSASEMMDRQVRQLVRLVDDLLDVSRISRGKIDLRREPIELAPIIQQAIETCRPAIETSKHNLTVELPPQPVFLDADPVRVAQALGNLLNNACKYSEREGCIAITVERVAGLPEHVEVRVKDNGVGIPHDMLPKIFEMFTQVDGSLERSQGGLGIGLTLVQRLVEMHGGSVSAHSEGPGRGSEFVVRLPILSDAATPTPMPTGKPAALQKPAIARRILIVDDNRDSATSLAMVLELKGHETRTAHDGLAAVEAAAAFRPDVVLLDIGLPKLNGYETARKIREQPWGQALLLVALNGWGQEDDRRKSREAGFNEHLVKPVDHATLIELLNELQH